MRRVVLWLASTVTVVVLLFGYHTSTGRSSTDRTAQTSSRTPATSTASPATSSAPRPSPSSTGAGPGRPSPSSAPSSESSPKPSATRSGTYAGSVAQTRWGPVQVEIAVAAGRVTDVTVLQQPQGNRRDLEINDRALPVLISETVDAQSAHIDMVSGATVTSDGYLTSLQSALDRAGI